MTPVKRNHWPKNVYRALDKFPEGITMVKLWAFMRTRKHEIPLDSLQAVLYRGYGTTYIQDGKEERRFKWKTIKRETR